MGWNLNDSMGEKTQLGVYALAPQTQRAWEEQNLHDTQLQKTLFNASHAGKTQLKPTINKTNYKTTKQLLKQLPRNLHDTQLLKALFNASHAGKTQLKPSINKKNLQDY